jgi:PAS domain S-box-containing protein
MVLLGENMVQYIEGKNKGETKSPKYRGNNIVLTIDQNENIVKFNKEYEKISGYSDNEVLNKQLLDFIPDRYSEFWKQIFSSSNKNKHIDDFKLPLLTKNCHEIMVSWSSFPLKNNSGVIGEINLVGKLIDNWSDADESLVLNSNYIRSRSYDDSGLILNKGDKSESVQKPSFGKGLYSLSEMFGRGSAKDFEYKMNELSEREKILGDLEDQLHSDKKEINQRIFEFRKWREKLEILENEVENRREDIVKREKILDGRIAAASDGKGLSVSELRNIDVDYHDILDKISDSAVVIQRGILKQVNDSFADLIGYSIDEIVEKSLFDFIIPEGFSELEEYYLNRLKGIDVSIYETAFLTKDNDKIFVEVSTRPTILNGEKAEIAVFKKVASQKKKIKIKKGEKKE